MEPVDVMASYLHTMVRRTLDLVSSYKQFGVRLPLTSKLKAAVKVSGYKLFRVLALPFGAVGSVAAFLRIPSCLFHLLKFALRVVGSAFFDDFTAVTRADTATNTDFAITALLRLFGVQYARARVFFSLCLSRCNPRYFEYAIRTLCNTAYGESDERVGD